MTRTTNARLAGIAYLVYFVAGVSSLALAGRPHAASLLAVVTSFSALVLGVTLYAITRDQDPELALLGLACRVIEAIPNHEGALYFAVATTIFAWLLLRGRMIPAGLAWLGVVASALLVVIIPLQGAGLLGGPTNWSSKITWVLWLPALVFELSLAAWFLVKGVAGGAPSATQSPALAERSDGGPRNAK